MTSGSPSADTSSAYVGVTGRIAALALDAIVMAVVLLVVAPSMKLFGGDRSHALAAAGIAAAMYFVWLPASSRQGTVGMSAIDVKIITSAGKRIGPLRSAVRFAASLALPVLVLLGLHLAGVEASYPATPLYVIAAALASLSIAVIDGKRRALHDLIAGTLVVRDTAEERRSFPRGWLIALAIALAANAILVGVNVHYDRVARRPGYAAIAKVAPIKEEVAAALLRSQPASPRKIDSPSPDGPMIEVLSDARIVLRFPERFERGTVTYTPAIREGKVSWRCVVEGRLLGWARAACGA